MNCIKCGDSIPDGLIRCELCSVPSHEAPRRPNLEEKVIALERLVIELALIAISTAHIQHHHKARLDQLLGDLQYAGMGPEAVASWVCGCGTENGFNLRECSVCNRQRGAMA